MLLLCFTATLTVTLTATLTVTLTATLSHTHSHTHTHSSQSDKLHMDFYCTADDKSLISDMSLDKQVHTLRWWFSLHTLFVPEALLTETDFMLVLVLRVF